MSKFSDEKLAETKFVVVSKVTRGETPQDIKEKCLNLCKEYLAGIWNVVNDEQIDIRRISGGYTNQLYYCGLNIGINPIDDEPKEVAIKLYGKKWFKDDERLSDMVIVLLASENNLGPKIFGVFNDGEITEYIESHQFRIEDQNNPLLVNELSKLMARFHSLEVPLARESDWLKTYFEKSYSQAYKDFPIDDIIKEIKAENLLKQSVKQEYEWLLKCMKASNSPIVFSHNDFRGSNILVNNAVNDKSTRRLTLVDFEYSCYYYRGFDLGVCLDEFGRTDYLKYEDDINDQIIENFVRGYREESIKIHGEEYELSEQNSIKQLIRETKLFSLAADMFELLFLYSASFLPFSANKKDIMVGANMKFAKYLTRKDVFERQGVFPSV